MPVNAFDGKPRLGLVTVRSGHAAHEPYGGPAGLVRLSTRATAAAFGPPDVVFNHLGPSGNHLPRFGPHLSAGSNPWARHQRRRRPFRRRPDHISAALRWMRDFTSTACGWTPCTPWRTLTAIHIPRGAFTRNRHAGRGIGRPLVTGRRERPQRDPSVHRAAHVARSLDDRSRDDDIHPRAAQSAVRPGEQAGLLRGISGRSVALGRDAGRPATARRHLSRRSASAASGRPLDTANHPRVSVDGLTPARARSDR